MIVLFDTSIFIAGMIVSHPHHERSLSMLQKVKIGSLQAALCSHSLAECYAILTAYPITPGISPNLAERLIEENILSFFQIVELSSKDYREAIQRIVSRQLRSGAIYDALIYQAAVKKKVQSLYTWNTDDFKRLADPMIEIIQP